MGYTREICKACWSINAVGFDVPDDIWKAAVPERFRGSVLCVGCFTRFADEAMIPWDRDIRFYPVSMATQTGREQAPLAAARVKALTPSNETLRLWAAASSPPSYVVEAEEEKPW